MTLDRDEEDADEKDRLLETLTNQDIEKEVAHINTDKLADETFTERLLRFVCYVMIAFGFLGGLISFLFTFTTIFDDFSGWKGKYLKSKQLRTENICHVEAVRCQDAKLFV